MYYSSFGALALVIHIIINFEVLRKDRDAEKPVLKYKIFVFTVAVYYIVDMLWGLLYEAGIIPAVYMDTVLYFSAMALSVLFWTGYVVSFLGKKRAFGKILSAAGWGIIVFTAVCLIINFFVPVMFYFTPENIYVPGQMRFVTLISQVILFLATSSYALFVAVRSEGNDRQNHRTVGISGLVMTLFIVLQTIYPFMPFYAVGCLIATCLIHTFVERDIRHHRRMELGTAKQMAYTDPLTGVRNVHAYGEAKVRLEERLAIGETVEFGVIVFDLNGLKQINDTVGHEAGDKYIISACRLICRQFKHSPVFRIGGDEFVVFLEGEDYRNREDLLRSFDKQIEENQKIGEPVVSSGMAEYTDGTDIGFSSVFERADQRMYVRKKELKEMNK
ncbi:MAG: GGDEF domain-containing protein [Clostridia bacterium]|nr:GGDEF domain-containing protein [Clostridia bacterium]